MTTPYSCPDCHRVACLCDRQLCSHCEERHVHESEAVACGVPGCKNDWLCGTSCFELIAGVPVCGACMNSLDYKWRLLAVRTLAARRDRYPAELDDEREGNTYERQAVEWAREQEA